MVISLIVRFRFRFSRYGEYRTETVRYFR